MPNTSNDHPVGGPATDRRSRRALWVTALVLFPLLAVAAAWWFTRTAPQRASVSGHENHAAMGPRTDNVHPDDVRTVTLDSTSARRIGATFAAVTREALGGEVRTVGQVVVDETRVRTVSVKVDGWVEQLHVDYTGEHMTAGMPLFTIYSPMLVTAQEELLLARQLTRDVAGSAADTREGAADLVQAARRRLRWWDISEAEIARIEQSGNAQRTLTLYAPFGGVVLEKNVTAGQRVMAGESLYRVADLSSVWVDGEVYERDLQTVRVGQRVTATFDALPGTSVQGRVAYVYPTLSAETRTARVRVSMPNPASRLLPGMYATLRIDSDRHTTALTVPRGAVLATGDRYLVFVRLRTGQLESRPVVTGAVSDQRVEILQGVALGDTVVSSATFLIDAESNLGAALGGMANMPGMDMSTPSPTPPRPATPARSPEGHDMEAMPGMAIPPSTTLPSSPTRPASAPRAAKRGGPTS